MSRFLKIILWVLQVKKYRSLAIDKIRLGIDRAVTHGYYFGIMLDYFNPLLPEKHDYAVHHCAISIFKDK